MRRLLLLSIVLLVAACDSQSGDGITKYTVAFQPLNNSGVNGTASILVDGNANVISVDVDVTGLDDRVHAQHIHARVTEISECPSAAADANNDGFVDVLEGLPRYGGILLPLDNDISTQEQNLTGFPSGTSIDYSTSATVAELETALIRDDPDPSDPIVTLGASGVLAFEDWVIVIHGTNAALPASVATLPGLDNATTLPVACGVITP